MTSPLRQAFLLDGVEFRTWRRIHGRAQKELLAKAMRHGFSDLPRQAKKWRFHRHPLAWLLTYGLLICVTASAQSPAPDPQQGDGRVSKFYTWRKTIPTKPGLMLRRESLPSVLGLSGGGQERILYSSTDGVGGTKPVVVSGAVFLPAGTPPQGGWPIVAWAHGTMGMADVCAPSWYGSLLPRQPVSKRMDRSGLRDRGNRLPGFGYTGATPLPSFAVGSI